MRIGINTLFLIPKEVGGSETYLTQTLLALLVSFPSLEFVFFTNKENDDFFRALTKGKDQAVTFYKLNFFARNRFARIIREQWELLFLAKRYKIDLLWSPGYTAPLWLKCPQVITIYDMQYKSYPKDFSLFARWVTNFIIMNSLKKKSFAMTISDFSKQEIIKYTAVSPSRVRVVHLAASPAFAELIPANERKQILAPLISNDAPYILCVSHSHPHKNIHTLIAAFGMLLDAIPHKLVIVGRRRRGELALQSAISKVSDLSRILRVDYVSAQELIALYQQADLFVFPSLYEGFGLPILEAMMAGVPIITSRSGSIPEVAGDCALYFDGTSQNLADQIRNASKLTREDRILMSEKARKWARRFSWKRTAEQTVACFETALELGSNSRFGVQGFTIDK